MLLVLSPAKRLDFSPPPLPDLPATRPELSAETARLAKVTRLLTAGDLQQLMGISDDLAALNVKRFKSFKPRAEAGLQAAFAFAGDVYMGLRARELDAAALGWAQDRLRILSGLYGVLRPLDRIQPYRLEMGVRLATEHGDTLYDFWGDRLSRALNRAARGHVDRTLVNLASAEYFGSVDRAALKLPVLSCRFLQEQGGEARNLGMFAKLARGLMARYAVDIRVEAPEQLQGFNRDGYRFAPDLSTDAEWTFVRLQPAPKR